MYKALWKLLCTLIPPQLVPMMTSLVWSERLPPDEWKTAHVSASKLSPNNIPLCDELTQQASVEYTGQLDNRNWNFTCCYPWSARLKN